MCARSFITSALLATSLLSIQSQARELFPYERVQLTKEYIQSLPEEDAQLFAFEGQLEESLGTAAVNKTPARCRYGPDDGKWPADKAWARLSKQLSLNAFITAVPQSSVCWGNSTTNNPAACQALTSNWTNSYAHIDDPTEILSPIYQGLTCTPPTIYNSSGCTLGGYPAYVINAKNVLDLQLGINFARNDGLRLVVKNTGHDFSGKSAGAHSLSLWTHGLKDLQYFDNYVDESGYKGPAIKAGAGVQAYDLYKFANEHGVMAVAGEGQTVGVMGGYIQGGGHSPLSSLYGMAADHVLGFEVIAASGEFATANSSNYPDLFWALRGGGGGTFGVVTSVTIKAFKDVPVTTASWSLSSTTTGKDKFWAAVRAFVDHLIPNADNGTYSYFVLSPNGADASFIMQPFFAPNQTATQVKSLLQPFSSQLAALNISFAPKITEYTGFYPAWQAQFPLEPQSDIQTAFGSRLFPRSNFASETGKNITFKALQDTVQAGQNIIGFNLGPTLARGGNPDNSVNPAWRNAVLHAITGQRWDIKASRSDILAARKSFTNGTMQKWRDITPGSGSYLNEADRLEPNWQQSFWGNNYAKLLQAKKDWDAKNVFWAVNAVGSEDWVVESVDGLPNENGKLCKVNGTTITTSKAGSSPTAAPVRI